MARLKLNLHCFSTTGRSDRGRELANPGCFLSPNFANLKQTVCVQAMLGWGGCAWDAFGDPRRWSKSYCRARLEPRRARPPLPLQDVGLSRFKASQHITETPLWSPSPQLDLHSPHLGQLVLGWRQDFLLLEPGLSAGSQAKAALSLPPPQLLLITANIPPRSLPSTRRLCRVCSADAAHYEAERAERGDGERGNQPGLPETLNLIVR